VRSGVDGASLASLPQPYPRTAREASEQIIGGAPRAAVSNAVTSIGAEVSLAALAALSRGSLGCAIAGDPLSDESAKVAITNPITRCIITPFMLPAGLRGKLKNQH
jgi:hypothetical protein